MFNLTLNGIIVLATYLLGLVGTIAVLAYFAVRILSDTSRLRGRPRRISEADTKDLRDNDEEDDTEPVEDQAMRASTADRDRTIERLREETAQGRLTFNEFEERMESAQSAKTLGDLSQLTQDLPSEASSVFRKPRGR